MKVFKFIVHTAIMVAALALVEADATAISYLTDIGFCNGTVVGRNKILTVKHCIIEKDDSKLKAKGSFTINGLRDGLFSYTLDRQISDDWVTPIRGRGYEPRVLYDSAVVLTTDRDIGLPTTPLGEAPRGVNSLPKVVLPCFHYDGFMSREKKVVHIATERNRVMVGTVYYPIVKKGCSGGAMLLDGKAIGVLSIGGANMFGISFVDYILFP